MSTSMTLYEIAEPFRALLELDELGEAELTELDNLNLALTEKVSNIVAFTDHLESFVALCKTEEARIKARKSAAMNKIQSLKDYLISAMDIARIKKIDCGTKTVSIQKTPPKVVIEDIEKISAEFFTIIPETTQLDKLRVKKALAANKAVEGVRLEQGRSIRFR